ncbi:hypothetical protein [Neptuniibacter marinus]|uniref:hypothetical protein n=1 Tax=Neptuniibacter marinus TaxID=1806670 RepID=UPI003B5BA9B8
MSVSTIKQQLLKDLKAGNTLKALCDIYLAEVNTGPSSSLILAVAKLHNTKTFDLNELLLGATRNNTHYDLFILLDVYASSLPYINCTTADVMGCITHLLNQAGNDLSVGDIHKAFLNFCKKDIQRSKDALFAILTDTDKYSSLTSSAILAAQKLKPSWALEQIKELIEHETPSIRSQAFISISQLDLAEDQTYETLITLIKESVEKETDDFSKAQLLRAIISIGEKSKTNWDDIKILINKIAAQRQPEVVYAASHISAFFRENIPQNILDQLTNCLTSSPLEYAGTVSNIDYILVDQIKDNRLSEAAKLLECLLKKNAELEVRAFKSFSHLILKDQSSQLSMLITMWFLSGDPKLCKAVMDLMEESPKDTAIAADIKQLSTSDKNLLFVSRKAIGWLFSRPVAASSFILSLYPQCSAETKKELNDLLFDPLLLSYSGDLKDYLKSISQQPAYQDICNSLFTKLESYKDGLKDTYGIKELKAPQENSQLYRKEFNKGVQKAQDEGPKRLFHEICTVQHLLYGNSSVFYVHDGNGNQRRSEMKMHSISHSAELPRLNIIDPEGLDYMLRTFRVERLK